MEVTATLRYARIAPRKLRLAADLCRGLPAQKAHVQLNFSQRRSGKMLAKLLESAIANAQEKGGIDVDNLYVKRVFVNEGPTLKRYMPRAQGRATEIQKKTSHVTICLDEAR